MENRDLWWRLLQNLVRRELPRDADRVIVRLNGPVHNLLDPPGGALDAALPQTIRSIVAREVTVNDETQSRIDYFVERLTAP
jgi:hypothetical protein